jgi:hypothetical protein
MTPFSYTTYVVGFLPSAERDSSFHCIRLPACVQANRIHYYCQVLWNSAGIIARDASDRATRVQ